MRRGRRGGDRVALEALNAEENELTDEERTAKMRAGHLAREDRFLKLWDSSMKKHTDSINNEINKYVQNTHQISV